MSGNERNMENILSTGGIPSPAEAYWISPAGQILPVRVSHIRDVLDFPEAFGCTKDELVAKYKEFKEPVGFEGKARHEIMLALIQRRWIRIRYINRGSLWSVELMSLTKRCREYLWDWATGQGKHTSKLDDVRIIELKSNIPTDMTLEKMVGDGLYSSSKKGRVSSLVWVNSAAELLDLAPVAYKYLHLSSGKVQVTFSRELRKFKVIANCIVPKEAGVHGNVIFSDLKGMITFKYILNGLDVILVFFILWDGECLVSVSGGLSGFRRFSSVDELSSGFSEWYNKLGKQV